METVPYLAVDSDARLLLIDDDKRLRLIHLNKRQRWSFGRETEMVHPDISVHSPIASRDHGEFVCVDEQWFYIDKGGRNGTFCNGKKVLAPRGNKRYPLLLNNGDVLRVDYEDLTRPDNRGVWMMFLTENVEGEWRSHTISDGTTVLGRDPSCQIVLPEPYISARHCVIERRSDGCYVRDAGSMAGTWFNGRRLLSEEKLGEKDTLMLCDRHFIFTGGRLIYNDPTISDVNKSRVTPPLLRVDIDSKSVKEEDGYRRIELLRDIHFSIPKGELIAILGTAGAGKSTLMDCINGINTDGMLGQITFGGEDLIANFDRLKYLIGSVPQFSTFHANLTVERELMLAAQKRLPRDMSKKEIRERLDRLIKQLGIEAKRKTPIGKCSGGEQRRVNIAMDLIAIKLLYCLDEPDAGLDPNAKKELVSFLRAMAHEEGRTILAIIHDVSEIELFDKVILLAKYEGVGRLAFYGTPEKARERFGCEIKEVYRLLADRPQDYFSCGSRCYRDLGCRRGYVCRQ